MTSYNYKGYIISIEHALDIEGFQGSIRKDDIYYSVTKPMEFITHIRHENVGSFWRPKYEDIERKEKLPDQTFKGLKKDLETIVDGIECFMVGERNKMVRELKEKEEILTNMWLEVRDLKEEK